MPETAARCKAKKVLEIRSKRSYDHCGRNQAQVPERQGGRGVGECKWHHLIIAGHFPIAVRLLIDLSFTV